MNGRLENEIKIQNESSLVLDRLPNYVKNWYYNMVASDMSASSCKDYVMKISKFLSYINSDVLNINAEDITEDIVQQYMISIKTRETKNGIVETSDSYRHTVWYCLNNFLGYLCSHGLIEKNYMINIKKGKNNDLQRINQNRILLTERDFKKILNAARNYEINNKLGRQSVSFENRDVAILELFMTTGMRESALANINIDDINFNDMSITIIDKGDIMHKCSMSDELATTISDWIDEREYYVEDKNIKTNALFISEKGNRISTDAIYDMIKKYTKIALGKELSPHKLRAGFISILYKKTKDIEFCRRAVGHSNIATTQRYITTSNKEKEESMNIMSSLIE